MGAWGPRLYEDDLAADVRDTYMETFREKGDKAAVFSEFSELQDDPDDGPILWFALANTSKRATPKQLQYIDCFTPIPALPGEWIPPANPDIGVRCGNTSTSSS